MPILIKFIAFQTTIFLPFLAGFALQGRFANSQRFTRRLLRVNIIGVEPSIVFWCVWGLDFSAELIFLPLAGLLLVLAGLLAGMPAAAALGLAGKKRQSFLLSASLANHGFTMGGFLCYFFLGESGLGLSVILLLYFIPCIYGIVFPWAKASTGRNPEGRNFFMRFVADPQNMPLFAMLAAALLRLAGIRRPAAAFPVDGLLFLSIALYYLSLGINFIRVDLKALKKEHLYLALIKFVALPLCTYAVLCLTGLSAPVKAVVMIQSFMPAAVYSVVTAVLFDLDAGLASSLLVCNTLIFLTVVLPCMFIFKICFA